MNKDNIFKSSNFYMSENDVLHILLEEEVGNISIVLGGEESVTLVPGAVIALPASDITADGFTAHWQMQENCDGYYFNLATDDDMTPHILGYENFDVGNVSELVVTGLTNGVTYYYTISGYNEVGEGEDSNIISVGIPIVYVTDVDGNVYTTVIIGTQEWMVQNLRTLHYRDGSDIPNLPVAANWIADTTGAYCSYDNDPLNITDYGCLYNRYAVDHGNVVAGADLAPAGWKIPAETDFETLETFLGGDVVAGGKLKEIGTTHWNTPNTNATDEYGFKALPGGKRDNLTGAFVDMNEAGILWSSTLFYDPAVGWGMPLRYDLASAILSVNYLAQGSSVRCMRDLSVGTTYITYTDGISTFRKGVRSHALVVDVALTVLAFSGVEGVDWENIKMTAL